MINKMTKTTGALMAVSALALSSLATSVAAQSGEIGYVQDTRGGFVKSGTGLCYRTGYWTPAMANMECDPDLVPKAPPAPAPAAPRSSTPTPPPPPAARPAAPPAPRAAVAPVTQKVTLQADALFDFDKAVIRADASTKLNDLVGRLKGINLEVIIAIGHTDRIGSKAYNQKLSMRRAEAVKAYMVSKGIPANRVYTEGKGPTQPVTADKCRKMGAENRNNKKLVACLAPDRRVEIEVVGTQAK